MDEKFKTARLGYIVSLNSRSFLLMIKISLVFREKNFYKISANLMPSSNYQKRADRFKDSTLNSKKKLALLIFLEKPSLPK